MKLDYVVNGIMTATALGALVASWFVRKNKTIDYINGVKVDSGILEYLQGWEKQDVAIVWESYSQPLKERIQSSNDLYENEMMFFKRAAEKKITYSKPTVIAGKKTDLLNGYWIATMNQNIDGVLRRELTWILTTDVSGKITFCMVQG